MSRIAATNLGVRRGGRAILADISLALPAGAFVAVIGANGAGKSTLLSALAGLLRPDSGEVTLDGAPLSAIDRRQLARRRAYLPQAPHVDWPIPVERLVALGLTPHLPAFGDLGGRFEPRLTEMLESFDLASRRDQPATTLSGGELARAMLGRALIGEPEILIADEPSAGLDPRHSLDTLARLKALADAGRLVVAAIHDLTLAARHATHLAALKDGRLAAFGTVGEVLSPELLRSVFEAEAKVTGHGAATLVDFVG